MIINVLGNCAELDKIRSFADKKILLIEDNCESLGSVYKKKFRYFWRLQFFFILFLTSNYCWRGRHDCM